MKLIELFDRPEDHPSVWDGAYKIPWDEPGFSRRMLREHLSQDHDLASRRQATIEAHVVWIKSELLGTRPARILDLGCGPGFYSERLADAGHTCLGIDISPASIAYARKNCAHPDLCRYVHGDIRTVEYGLAYDLAMMIYGEFNVFAPAEAATILHRIHTALKPGGQVLIEAHTYPTVKKIGEAPNSWYRAASGLFGDRPHLCLISNEWLADDAIAASRFVVIDAATAEIEIYRNVVQAYTPDRYRTVLREAGFSNVELLPAWGKGVIADDDPHFLLRASRP